MKQWLKVSLALVSVAAVLIVGVVLDVQLRYIHRLYPTSEAIAPAPVALVLGASITANRQPSDALRDRLLVAQSLYDRKVVQKIFVTGDDGAYRADETEIMSAFLINHGVTSTDIIVDGRGFRTYESCKRAVQDFHIANAIIITQRFHIGRALYLCNQLGMDAYGYASDLTTYQRILFFTARDLLASVEAWFDINIRPPKSPVSQ